MPDPTDPDRFILQTQDRVEAAVLRRTAVRDEASKIVDRSADAEMVDRAARSYVPNGRQRRMDITHLVHDPATPLEFLNENR